MSRTEDLSIVHSGFQIAGLDLLLATSRLRQSLADIYSISVEQPPPDAKRMSGMIEDIQDHAADLTLAAD